MSETAHRLLLMRRALARSDRELFGHRSRYEEVQQRLARQLIAGDYAQEGGALPQPDERTRQLLAAAHARAQAARFAS